MARIPDPRPGLVFRYRYLRLWQYHRGEQVGKTLIVPIQSDRPADDQLGVELTPDDKNHVGLPNGGSSYLIVSEANIDRWPNGDLCLVPGLQNSFSYERSLAGPTLSRVMRAFLRAHEARKVRLLVRHP